MSVTEPRTGGGADGGGKESEARKGGPWWVRGTSEGGSITHGSPCRPAAQLLQIGGRGPARALAEGQARAGGPRLLGPAHGTQA